MENFEQMHLTMIKENHPLIACVTLVDIKHLIYDNEVLDGFKCTYLTVIHTDQGKNQYPTCYHISHLAG